MSTPRLEDAPVPVEGASFPPVGDPDTALIARLAGEFFRSSGQGAASPSIAGPTASLPSAPAGGLSAFAPTDAGSPFAPPPSFLPEKGKALPAPLSGGFPATTSGTQPVHPAVTSASEAPSSESSQGIAGISSGAHEPNSGRTHSFGEPRQGALLCKRPEDRAAPRASAESEPEFYFLPSNRAATPAQVPASPSSLDIEKIRRDFPALNQRVNGRPLVYLDNAATTHKPQAVIDATSHFYARDNANIHRAAHALSERATAAFEAGREKVRRFLGAASKEEIVFVRGTTEGINLVAQTYGRQNIGKGDEIILSGLEHHANIVPWQLLSEQVGAVLRVIPVNDDGELILEEYVKLFGPKTKFVSVVHVSNALGTVNPVERIVALAHAHGVPVLIDGAQSTPHLPVNVVALDADFYVFSGHKVFGPTGIGALYGKAAHLEKMPPYQGGGHMIEDVRFEKTVYRHAPEKFEAGTPDIAGVVGLGAALDYITELGIPAIAAYEHELLEYATHALGRVPGLRFIGTAREKASVLSFVIPGIPNDRIAKHLDKRGIAVRAGHHCAQPTQRRFGLESTVRPSLAFYNNRADVDALVAALLELPKA